MSTGDRGQGPGQAWIPLSPGNRGRREGEPGSLLVQEPFSSYSISCQWPRWSSAAARASGALGPPPPPGLLCLCPSPARAAPANTRESAALPVFLHLAFHHHSLRDPVQPFEVPSHSRSCLILAAGGSISPRRNGAASLTLILTLSCSRPTPPNWALLSSHTWPRTRASTSNTFQGSRVPPARLLSSPCKAVAE